MIPQLPAVTSAAKPGSAGQRGHSIYQPWITLLCQLHFQFTLELQTKVREDFNIKVKAPLMGDFKILC